MNKIRLDKLETVLQQRKMLAFIDAALDRKKTELIVHQQVWNRALQDLETEIVKAKSGIDLSSLLID